MDEGECGEEGVGGVGVPEPFSAIPRVRFPEGVVTAVHGLVPDHSTLRTLLTYPYRGQLV